MDENAELCDDRVGNPFRWLFENPGISCPRKTRVSVWSTRSKPNVRENFQTFDYSGKSPRSTLTVEQVLVESAERGAIHFFARIPIIGNRSETYRFREAVRDRNREAGLQCFISGGIGAGLQYRRTESYE